MKWIYIILSISNPVVILSGNTGTCFFVLAFISLKVMMTKHSLITQDRACLKHKLIAWKKKRFLYYNVYTCIKSQNTYTGLIMDENVVRKKQYM